MSGGFNLNQLNPDQRQAATRIRGPLMILAGAGTGKTRVITCRIAHMIASGIAPEDIVALTFTNKAAREMTERAKAMVGEPAARVHMGTFHSFCLGILRKFHREAGLPSPFGLADTSDQLDLVRRALSEKGWDGQYDHKQLHWQIGQAKNQLLGPDDIRAAGASLGGSLRLAEPALLATVYELYERQLLLNRKIDFDDCIFKTVRLLRAHETVRAALRQQHRYLMVDEYQDTNLAQFAILELLASDQHDVCVVGDDDQSIYSWRGAMYEVLERFEAAFPASTVVKLQQNYRCSNVILNAANAVIVNNARRKEKSLWSASEATDPIRIVVCENETEEARSLTERVIGYLGAGMRPKDIAVLYRANALARPIEFALREARIPYKTFGGQSFFERKEVKDALSYFRLIADKNDRLAFWRAVNTPNRGIGIRSLEKIEAVARETGKSPFAVAEQRLAALGRTQEAVDEFVALVTAWKNAMPDNPVDLRFFGDRVCTESGLKQDIRAMSDNPAVREARMAALMGVPQLLEQVARDQMEEDGRIDLFEILDMVCLDQDRREEKKKDGDFVSLMTVHAAKGLEFAAVQVVGVEEDLFPHKNSVTTPEGLAEERRLFYVALTRAKTRLDLSYCQERTSGQSASARQPSRFLQEVPVACTDRRGEGSQLQSRSSVMESRRGATADKVSQLRASLRDVLRQGQPGARR